MTTGILLRFDEVRGYGFIAPDEGGEDVFVHANALTDEKRAYRPGVAVAFEVVRDARGSKATSVQIVSSAGTQPKAEPARRGPEEQLDDDLLCDVLPATTLRKELINLCLESVPSMTGEQIKLLSQALIAMARQHGWVED